MGSLRVLAGGVVLAAVSLLVPVEADAATAAISAKLSKTTIELGQSVAVTGTVTPSGATSRVVVQRSLGGGRWSDRAVGVVAPSGTFSVTIRPSGAGLYALRVRSGGGTVVSRNLFLKVKLGPAQAVRGVDWSRYAHPAALCADGFEAVAVAPPGLRRPDR